MFGVQSPFVAGDPGLHVMLLGDYAHNPLVLKQEDSDTRVGGAIVSSQLFLHLNATLALWNREQLGLELVPGADEVSLALVADAWSRTYRSRAVTWSRSEGVTETRHGVRIRPDTIVSSWPGKHLLASTPGITPAAALDDALHRIGARYGTRTAEFVAMQLEYPTKH